MNKINCCEQENILEPAGLGLYTCPLCPAILKSLTTMSFLYCELCQYIFDKGCIHSNLRLSYCATIITSYNFKGVKKRFYGMPKFSHIENFERLEYITWECTCRFRDRCRLDKNKNWAPICRNDPSKNYNYIVQRCVELHIFSNGELPEYLLLEILQGQVNMTYFEIFTIIQNVVTNKKFKLTKKIPRIDFFKLLAEK